MRDFAIILVACAIIFCLVNALRVRSSQDSLTTQVVAAYQPQLVEEMATRCAFCHGPGGQSDFAIWPSLAGLHSEYIEAQLTAYAKGSDGPRRGVNAAQMHALAAALTQEERKLLADYYAGLPAPRFEPDMQASLGQMINVEGTNGIVACAGCHGPMGEGDPLLGAPRIGGQQARYLVKQMRAYADGSRGDNYSGMAEIASAMNEEQLAAVAAYLGND